MVPKFGHEPVMLQEVIHLLKLQNGMVVVDATIGTGGHALEIINHIAPDGALIGIDRDKESLMVAKERLQAYGTQCTFVQDNFYNIDKILPSLSIGSVDAVLLDLGISSYQLDNAIRGFSFVNEGPLDMRMDRESSVSAFDLINNLSPEELAALLWRFGQERYSRRIASMIARHRKDEAIDTTTQLSRLVAKAVYRAKTKSRIHPATRTFQALRIAVNRELESLELFLDKIAPFINTHGRICVIAFHSLEDRIVKVKFRDLAKTKHFRLIEKKPFTPTFQESKSNPRSRSAKLRILEKL